MALDVVETLCDLVSIPSVNPMGRAVTGDEFYEHAMTDRLEQVFGELGLPCRRQEVAPKRSNIVARLDGAQSARARDPRHRRPSGPHRPPGPHGGVSAASRFRRLHRTTSESPRCTCQATSRMISTTLA